MIFECEGKKGIQNPKPNQVRKALLSLRSYGPSSYASLTDIHGNYLQTAGGGVTCLLEMYRADTKERLRAFGDVTRKSHPDGTVLVFSAGEIPMMADEWFTADRVVDAFSAFLDEIALPVDIHWRPAPGF